MSDWSKPEQVLATIQAGDEIARAQSENRKRINNAANGDPPLDAATAKKMNQRINVNFGDLMVPLANAQRSFCDAVLGQERFFKLTIPTAPAEKATEWSMFIGNWINDKLKDDEDLSEEYAELKESQIAAMVLHGPGPARWYHPHDILPEFIALEDFRVPTDTLVSFKNLDWFADRHGYRPGELIKKCWGRNAIPGWNKKAIAKILDSYKEVNFGQPNYTWETAPEKMAELDKQNGSFTSGDAMPTIPLWNFYFQDQDGGNQWYLSVVPETAVVLGNPEPVFLYQSDKPLSSKRSHLMQCQCGDLNFKAPFLFHSQRSLGFMLMDPTWWTNIFRCRLMQHAFESMNIWLKILDPAGRARANLVELYEKCVLPEGVSVVPQTERHQINVPLVESVQAQLKQLTNEAGAAYTHELDTGTQKEQTATQTMADLQRVNAMMSGLLSRFFRREKSMHREICRRFCIPNSTNRHAKEFQAACIRAGIPRRFLDVDLWKIEPEKPLGSGNPTMALMQADKMMSPDIFTKLGPDAQQATLRDAVAVYTGNPRLAASRVPEGKTALSDGATFAQSIFGTLMQGVPGIQWKEGLSVIDGISHLIGLLAGKCNFIQKQGGMTDVNTLAGLQNTAQFIGGLIQQLAQDETQKQLVKQMSDELGALNNEIKAFAQRLAESQQQSSQAQGNGEAAAAMMKIKTDAMMAQSKAKQKELDAAQKRRHKETAFVGDQKRKNISTLGELKRQQARTAGEIQAQKIKAANTPAPKNTSGQMKSTSE